MKRRDGAAVAWLLAKARSSPRAEREPKAQRNPTSI
jgi:hypothetical protein